MFSRCSFLSLDLSICRCKIIQIIDIFSLLSLSLSFGSGGRSRWSPGEEENHHSPSHGSLFSFVFAWLNFLMTFLLLPYIRNLLSLLLTIHVLTFIFEKKKKKKISLFFCRRHGSCFPFSTCDLITLLFLLFTINF